MVSEPPRSRLPLHSYSARFPVYLRQEIGQRVNGKVAGMVQGLRGPSVHPVGNFLDRRHVAVARPIDQGISNKGQLGGGLAVGVFGFPLEGQHERIPHELVRLTACGGVAVAFGHYAKSRRLKAKQLFRIWNEFGQQIVLRTVRQH